MSLRGVIQKIPPHGRRGKLIRNILCMVLLVLAGYIILGAPALSARHAFRRAERARLREPSEILAVVRTNDLVFPPEKEWQYGQPPADTWARGMLMEKRGYVIGRLDDELVCLATKDDLGLNQPGPEHIVPITGEVTLVRAFDYQNDGALYYVYTTLPDAHRVTLEVRTVAEEENEASGLRWFRSNWCAGTGENQGSGVFVIPILRSTDGESTDEVLEGVQYRVMETHVVITNAAGETIYDETLIVEEEKI